MSSRDEKQARGLSALWRAQNRRKTILALLVVLAGVAFYFLLYRSAQVQAVFRSASGALTPIFLGLVLGYLLNPLDTFLQTKFEKLFCRKEKHRRAGKVAARTLSIALSILMVIAALVLFGLLVIPEIGRSLANAVNTVPAQIQELIAWINKNLEGHADWAGYLQQGLETGLQFLQNWVTTSLPGIANSLLSYVTSGVINVVKSVFDLIVALVVAVYVLKDKKLFLAQSKKVICALMNERHANRVFETVRHAHKIVGGYLIGMIIEALLVGVVSFICLSLMDMPYTLLVSVIVCVTNVIPFFGPIFGGAISALLILLADPQKGLIFIVYVIVLQQIEGNIIAPRVLGDSTGVSAFWVTFALLLFGNLFGFLGMLFAVPIFAVLYYLAGLWLKGRLERRTLPTDTRAYTDATGIADGKLTKAETPLPPKDEA